MSSSVESGQNASSTSTSTTTATGGPGGGSSGPSSLNAAGGPNLNLSPKSGLASGQRYSLRRGGGGGGGSSMASSGNSTAIANCPHGKSRPTYNYLEAVTGQRLVFDTVDALRLRKIRPSSEMIIRILERVGLERGEAQKLLQDCFAMGHIVTIDYQNKISVRNSTRVTQKGMSYVKPYEGSVFPSQVFSLIAKLVAHLMDNSTAYAAKGGVPLKILQQELSKRSLLISYHADVLKKFIPNEPGQGLLYMGPHDTVKFKNKDSAYGLGPVETHFHEPPEFKHNDQCDCGACKLDFVAKQMNDTGDIIPEDILQECSEAVAKTAALPAAVSVVSRRRTSTSTPVEPKKLRQATATRSPSAQSAVDSLNAKEEDASRSNTTQDQSKNCEIKTEPQNDESNESTEGQPTEADENSQDTETASMAVAQSPAVESNPDLVPDSGIVADVAELGGDVASDSLIKEEDELIKMEADDSNSKRARSRTPEPIGVRASGRKRFKKTLGADFIDPSDPSVTRPGSVSKKPAEELARDKRAAAKRVVRDESLTGYMPQQAPIMIQKQVHHPHQQISPMVMSRQAIDSKAASIDPDGKLGITVMDTLYELLDEQVITRRSAGVAISDICDRIFFKIRLKIPEDQVILIIRKEALANHVDIQMSANRVLVRNRRREICEARLNITATRQRKPILSQGGILTIAPSAASSSVTVTSERSPCSQSNGGVTDTNSVDMKRVDTSLAGHLVPQTNGGQLIGNSEGKIISFIKSQPNADIVNTSQPHQIIKIEGRPDLEVRRTNSQSLKVFSAETDLTPNGTASLEMNSEFAQSQLEMIKDQNVMDDFSIGVATDTNLMQAVESDGTTETSNDASLLVAKMKKNKKRLSGGVSSGVSLIKPRATVDTKMVSSDPSGNPPLDAYYEGKRLKEWSIEEVSHYFDKHGFAREANILKEQEVDGHSLSLLQKMDVINLGIKLGPALKIMMHIAYCIRKFDR